MKRFLLLLAGLMLLASPAAAVDYLVHDQDGHGTTKCEFSQAVQVNIAGFDYQPGDRTFMCLAPKPPRVFHGGNGGGSGGLYALIKEAKDAANAPKPDPVDPDPVEPDPVEPDPQPGPGDCQRVSDCPIEPDPKPDPEPGECQNKADCVSPDPQPEPNPQPEPGDCGNNGRPCNPNNPGNGNGNGNPPCPPNNKHCR